MLSHILDVLIGKCIECNCAARKVEHDILAGHLLLQNIAVRPEALQHALGLPLVVQAGVIGRVEMRIPWKNLDGEPARLLVDDVLLMVGPRVESEWDCATEEQCEIVGNTRHVEAPDGARRTY
eukprot:4842575-Prymnesium_polylepis.1